MLTNHWVLVIFYDLLKHYKTVSKSLLEMIFIMFLNLMKYNLQTQQISNIQIKEGIIYNNGKMNVMIKKEMVKGSFLSSHQKQIRQLEIQEHQAYLRSVKIVFKLKQVQILVVEMFFVALNEQIVFKLIKIFLSNRFSTGISKSMGRFIIQLLLIDETWSTRYKIPKNDR